MKFEEEAALLAGTAQASGGIYEVVAHKPGYARVRLRLERGGFGMEDIYLPFDGVFVQVNDYPRGRFEWRVPATDSWSFEWCQCGRCEVLCSNGKGYHVASGDCSAHDRRAAPTVLDYPMARYRGITATVDRGVGFANLAAHAVLAGIDLDCVAERWSGAEGASVFAADEALATHMESFLQVGERACLARYGLKVVELLCLLASCDPPENRTFLYAVPQHRVALLAAKDLLSTELDREMTIDDAAAQAGMGRTVFKERFSACFGVSPMAYRRQCRMQQAAVLLEREGLSVTEVAGAVGYRNPSKFSAAFAREFGVAPSAYRDMK